ncbi:Putative iron-sulfur cluster insertion protein ErpA [Candidatus Johnevansia muelleri]|uniref:Putative iron-sulfur cluster insertion protein ErpA n=1 Tax=Candidatus Johnevansia muelleri TaxID=1495769 RepID=A0A078KIB5_9GAMM|nr:Putative iron-sulfur cluster insertion protein ErpA [Candidatus Evansia muelleri]
MKNLHKSLIITNKAANCLKKLINEKNYKILRIGIIGGGCSGLKYNFYFTKNLNNDDIRIKNINNIEIIIDSFSYQYLLGSTLDYEEELLGSKFIIKNPNAITTCSCGASFSIS